MKLALEGRRDFLRVELARAEALPEVDTASSSAKR
jgi:hypothetical protein